MAYNEKAKARRRCKALRKDGKPCQAYAMWGDKQGRCMAHAGRCHRGKRPNPPSWRTKGYDKAKYRPCTCIAYPFPHRPGSGYCRWPDEPIYQVVMKAGRRSLSSRYWSVKDLIDGIYLRKL